MGIGMPRNVNARSFLLIGCLEYSFVVPSACPLPLSKKDRKTNVIVRLFVLNFYLRPLICARLSTLDNVFDDVIRLFPVQLFFSCCSWEHKKKFAKIGRLSKLDRCHEKIQIAEPKEVLRNKKKVWKNRKNFD